jgi:ferredoxin
VWLKRIRVAVAAVFILAASALFIDFAGIFPTWLRTLITSTQIVPSLIHTVVSFGMISIVFFFILTSTLLFGRIYCSAICPLGIFQDIIIRISKRINRRRRFKFKQPQYALHYVLFSLAAIFFFFGSVLLLNLFEPFSNYGRIMSNIVGPSIVLINNALVHVLTLFELSFLFQLPVLHINAISVLAPICFLILILYLSYYHGRLFCNLLCPAGALLGILSRLSVFKIVIDENNCKECGLCERVCKANCIESGSKGIDFAACVGCFNCVYDCPTGGINYEHRWRKRKINKIEVNEGRRKVLKTSIIPVIGLMFSGIDADKKQETGNGGFEKNKKYPISPPGSKSIERFSKLCTACHLCVSSCPTQVLAPSLLEYGIAGIFQPKMNYAASYCNFDCVICGRVCPTGAILPLDVEVKKSVQIGKANFNKNDCIVITKKKDCGACSEHCPTKAVTMVPYERLVLPEVKEELCVGCGACEHACPASPDKAIYVVGNSIHLTAKKPQSQKIEKSFDSKQDFPF